MQISARPLSRPTITLHWLVAIVVIGMLAFGLYLEDYPRGPDREMLAAWHATIGMVALVLGAVRLLWRLREGLPPPVAPAAAWQETLARTIHWFLLAAVLMMPLSGIVTTLGHGKSIDLFGLATIGPMAADHTLAEAGEIVHAVLSKLLILALLVHAAAALKHHILDRDATLARMLGRAAR